MVADAMSGWLGERLVFLDLHDELVEQQVDRMRQRRASGPRRPVRSRNSTPTRWSSRSART
jgi:hypothetical protein